MNKINIRVGDLPPVICDVGITVASLMKSKCDKNGYPFIAALVNNDLVSLTYTLTVNSELTFVTAASSHGLRIYRRSLCVLLDKAILRLRHNPHEVVGIQR